MVWGWALSSVLIMFIGLAMVRKDELKMMCYGVDGLIGRTGKFDADLWRIILLDPSSIPSRVPKFPGVASRM